ncbi:DUF1566 domain-containing protein [Vibrio tubiashii]|uniref:DUF1566 domain-containing protein n=1 Tax=Vibrio tubiashii TaxID=29498 RepID=UPI003CE4B458
MGVLVKKLGAGAISVALIGCGGGSEPDSKLSPSVEPSASNRLTGVVMDGYLVNANVCLDKNKNSICDSGDGNIVQTDSQGKYELPVEGSTQGYRVLVEAIANKTIDLDNPNQTITKDFTLESPVTHSDVVSPMTSMIASMADLTGESFDEAARTLAADLNVSEDVLKSDYVSGASSESQQIHMLARGITRVIQSAQNASKDGGVTEEFARKGSMNRLANLDVAAMKQRTDNLSHGAQNTEQALEQLASDYRDDLKIDHDDIKGDVVTTVPRAPKKGVVDDSADTFDWSLVKPFASLSDYEYSLDNGINWIKVAQKPISVGTTAIDKGAVQVRVAAKPAKFITAGKPLKSAKAFTETRVPPAPSNLVVNDAENTFDWQHSAGFSQVSDYEYTLDGGGTWLLVNTKPQKLADVAIAAGDLKLRVREDFSSARPTGLSTKSTQPMTVTPASPSAPSLVRANDDSDQFEIQLVMGFDVLKNYEINLGSGWQELTSNPYVVGNVKLDANTIRVRVKANPIDGRPAGEELLITQAFTKVLDKPAAPTLPLIDDANNQFGWTVVAGYKQPNLYELSIDGGQSFQAVTTNPLSIPDNNYNIGKVCVRVKANASNTAGSLLCNDKPFTVTPNAPMAPTGGIVNDAANTFDWSWVAGFETAADYEVSIESGDWSPVASKPITLQDRIYVINSIQLRVKANPVNGRPAGAALSNQSALTKQPDKPSAPTSLVVDDNANTLDWTNVAGFSELANYEWSADSGSNWTPVLAKPIVIGDIAKSKGAVQIRVRGNSQNGMPAGVVASNPLPFTETPLLPAPSNGEIKVANNSVAPNMISWDYVNSGENYNRPEHYEFTVDQGATWNAVTSNPQFIGPRAYDKSNVGLRIKKNAITGKDNASGSILWATSLTGQFGPIQYVPMASWNQAVGYSLYHGWNSYHTNCIAEYDVQGQGDPIFWVKMSPSKGEDVFTKVSEFTACGIKHWKLPLSSEAVPLTRRKRDTLPSFARSYLISDYQITWVDESGTAIAYKNGVKDTSEYTSKYPFVKWQLASGSVLLGDVTSKMSTMNSLLSQQSNELKQAELFLTLWLASNQNKQKSYSTLHSEANLKLQSLQSIAASWATQKSQQKERLDELAFNAQMAQARTDAQSVDYISKVSEFQNKFDQLSKNNLALLGYVEATSVAGKLASIQIHADSMSSAQSALVAANSGSDIHQATLAFYSALFDIENDNMLASALKLSLNNALSQIDSQFSTLISNINGLLSQLDSTLALNNLDTLHTTAKDGLNRAHSNGYVVSQADALIDGQFAKLDFLGRYLPKAATYQQGWRCVLDTKLVGAKRVWTLLRYGTPGSKDEVVYNASGADLPSVLGSGGVLEQTNSANLCGFNDWKLPHPNQIKSLETASVVDLKGASKTIDARVFPNHKGLLPEYDKTYSRGGTRFFYWTSSSSSSSKQNTYVFANTSERPELRSFPVAGDGYDAFVTIARLMREDIIAWEFIAADGSVASDRLSAKCAKNPRTGEIWQIFQNATPSERYKTYDQIVTELANFNSQRTCGKSNWVLPSTDNMLGLVPNNSAVFPYYNPTSSSYYDNDMYVTDGSTSYSNVERFDMESSESQKGYKGSYDKYLFRFISK